MNELGLTKSEWNNIEYKYQPYDVETIIFMALHKWWQKKKAALSCGTFKDLSSALSKIEDNRHHLCQVCLFSIHVYNVIDDVASYLASNGNL